MNINAAGVNYSGYSSQEKVKTSQKNESELSLWLKDADKTCTDGSDDGKISAKETLKSFTKGIFGIAKTAINHPVATAATIAGAAAVTVLTGGAALPVMTAVGAAVGIGTTGYGAYKAANAETDGEAKQAWETIGNGVFATAASVLSAKPALNAAGKAGVASAQNSENLNAIQATLQSFKTVPDALKTSVVNAKGNISTWTSGAICAHSNKLQNSDSYMSKANDVQAYRFNPNGTSEEILKNNPGVFQGDDGNYYIPNKWNSEQPYLIDSSKEQMIMLYGGDDMAVCDGTVFNGSYVDTAAFHENGTKNYLNPSELEYGKTIDATKQAPGAFKVFSEGTKVQTLEGVRTVGEGDVVAIDHAGNPYVSSVKNIIKRNTGFSQTALDNLSKVDAEAVNSLKS